MTGAAAILALGMGQAVASPIYTFTFSGAHETGGGSFSTIENGDGSLTAVTGSEYDTIDGTTEYLTLITDPAAPTGIAYSPSGAFWYDDKLIPGSDPLLTLGGLMFVGTGGLEINIWSTGPGSYIFDRWQGGNYGAGEQKISFSAIDPPSAIDAPIISTDAITIPEPTSIALLGLGLLTFAVAGRKAKKESGL
jgi:hypothetical protein